MQVKCSLCPQEFDDDDLESLGNRCDRHTLGMHSMNRTIYSERTGSPSKPMGNHIYGKVEWITL